VILIWSGNAVVVKLGLQHVRPVPFTTARFLVGGLVILAVALARGHQVTRIPRLRILLPAALLGIVLNQLAFTYGVRLTTAVDVSLLMGLSPIITGILLVLVARKRLPWRTIVALALGFVGLMLVVLATARGGTGGSLVGDLITLGAPTAWAGYLLIVAGEARRIPATVMTPWIMLTGLMVLLPLAAVDLARSSDDWLSALWPLAYAAILATGVAYTAYFWAIPRLGVTGTAIYTYMQPAVGAAAGALFLHEGFGLLQALGALGILAAAYLGSWNQAPRREAEEKLAA
jgi:drug/metabolite transporter (DMT)-like permease